MEERDNCMYTFGVLGHLSLQGENQRRPESDVVAASDLTG